MKSVNWNTVVSGLTLIVVTLTMVGGYITLNRDRTKNAAEQATTIGEIKVSLENLENGQEDIGKRIDNLEKRVGEVEKSVARIDGRLDATTLSDISKALEAIANQAN